MIEIDRDHVHGEVSPPFEDVAREFERNFSERGESGAACAVYHRGQKVVDLWGGYRDRKTKALWEKDSLLLVYSTTKGLSSLAVALAHSRGLLDYDERVATYWPEFAQQGKGNVTVRQLLSHQAGLCVIDEPLDIGVVKDTDKLASILARQKPAWAPGDRHAYHTWSMGWYQSELIRRVDPHHRSLGTFFRDEIADPLELEFYIGLPDDIPDSRIAAIEGIRARDVLLHPGRMRIAFLIAFVNPNSLTSRAIRNPRVLGEDTTNLNKREWLSVEIPSGNGVGQVRSVAKAYGVFAAGGDALGIRPNTIAELSKPAQSPRRGWFDHVWRADMAYSLGFLKPSRFFQFGHGEGSFGFPGAGGSIGFADPVAKIGFAYGMNHLGFRALGDARESALRHAVYRCLGDS